MFRRQKDHISVEQETVEWERFVKLNYNRERVTFRQLWRAYEININETVFNAAQTHSLYSAQVGWNSAQKLYILSIVVLDTWKINKRTTKYIALVL